MECGLVGEAYVVIIFLPRLLRLLVCETLTWLGEPTIFVDHGQLLDHIIVEPRQLLVLIAVVALDDLTY